MTFLNQPQSTAQSVINAECQRYYSQAVGACLARLQRSVDLLQQPLLSDNQSASLLFDIDVQTDRLNTLMHHVLAASGLGALAAGESPEPVALAGVLTTLVGEYQALNAFHQFQLQVTAAPAAPAFAVPCLLIVFQLLLDNARRCTPAGRNIQIWGEDEPEGGGWIFHVRDTGAGIAPDKLASVFETPSLAAPAELYGLGLSLARFVVEALGGRMWVESQLGEGATFSFSLPRQILPRRWTVSRPKVLVIEGNSELCASLRAGYEEAGFEVQIADSAEAGLAQVAAFSPNLVLLELSPDTLAGQAALHSLRQSSDAAVIFLVAPAAREAVPDALWQGASDCLVKPFHIRELIARTRAILRRRPVASAPDLRVAARPRPNLIQRPKTKPMLQ